MSLRVAQLCDFPLLHELESEAYPFDEAATYDNMVKRCKDANEYFLCFCLNSDVPIGFINGTCIREKNIHHSSMSSHDANGSTLVIHSVTIASTHRRQRLGTKMLSAYIDVMKDKTKLNKILLLSKMHLLSFYKSCGFVIEGLSAVQHGKVQIMK